MQLIQSRKWSQSGSAAHPPRVLQEALVFPWVVSLIHIIDSDQKKTLEIFILRVQSSARRWEVLVFSCVSFGYRGYLKNEKLRGVQGERVIIDCRCGYHGVCGLVGIRRGYESKMKGVSQAHHQRMTPACGAQGRHQSRPQVKSFRNHRGGY